jgi:hypothetical protein
MWRTVFPNMAKWLPEDEADQLRFDFGREMDRLKQAALISSFAPIRLVQNNLIHARTLGAYPCGSVGEVRLLPAFFCHKIRRFVMPEAISDAQWAGIRELLEGEPPTHERVARAANVYVKSISLRAGEDSWRTLDFRFGRVRSAHQAMIRLARMAKDGEPLDPVEEPESWIEEEEREMVGPDEPLSAQARLARTNDMLSRRIEALLRRAGDGRPIETRQVAALKGLVELSERIAALAGEEIRKEQQKSDEELAGMLGLIDDRIVYLALGHAQRILAAHGIVDEAVEQALAEAAEKGQCVG